MTQNISSNKLMFSHVWEDSTLETSLIVSNKQQRSDFKILMVCSGGDTLIDILSSITSISKICIDVIDSNILQISLCVLKILLLHYLNNHFSPFSVAQFISTTNNEDIDFEFVNDSSTSEHIYTELELYKKIMIDGSSDNTTIDFEGLIDTLQELYAHLPYSEYLNVWRDANNMELLKRGICGEGELEKTFKDLMSSHMNFGSVFNNESLINKFSESAIKLSDDNSFISRFKFIYSQYIEHYGVNLNENKFYYRFIQGRNSDDVIDNEIKTFSHVTIDMLSRINFIHQDMLEYVKNGNTKYDLIQTSNVTDWLNNRDNVNLFVQNVHRLTKYGGRALWRSLNGSYDLFNILCNFYDKDHIRSLEDKSFFYKSVLCCELNNRLDHRFDDQKIMDVNDLIKNVDTYVNKVNLSDHSYFSRIIVGSDNMMTPEEFLMTQIEFYRAVKNWVKILIDLKQRLLENEEKEMAELLNENIEDELGSDSGGLTHAETFRNFLQAVNDFNTDKIDINVEILRMNGTKDMLSDDDHVGQFNSTLNNVVNKKNIVYALTYIGTIEYRYILISKYIKDYVDHFGIDQPHYTLHEILDVKHSTDLFTIALHICTSDSADHSANIWNGIKDGHRDFMHLYEEMTPTSI